MKGMKRILAMLLAVVMVVGLIPATVFAADTVLDAAIFCSDVHGSTSDLTSVLSGVKTSGVDYSSIGFVGDTCLTVANTTSTVQSALGDTDINVMFSYAASHDTENSADIATNWNYSGEVEGVSDYYLVYTIRETDMEDNTTAEDDFTTWYSGLTAAQKKLPIFIMSHRPLHHRRKDNANATDWYNAISTAAESSDIVVFWAHNHTGESSADTAAYYVAKNGDESITLGTTSSSGGDTVIPNFTYMNAGYINANNQNPARIGVATTVQITSDSLIFQDYNSSGEYTGSYSHNVTVTREFAASEPEVTLSSIAVSGTTEYTVGDELALTVTATYSDGTADDVTADATFSPAELTASGVYTVTASYGELTDTIDVTVNLYDEVLAADGESLLMGVEAFSQGATALEVTWDDAAEAILDAEGLYTDYVVYDLALTNPGEKATYAMSLVENMDTANLAVYHVADDGTLTLVEHTIENDCVVFTTSLTGAFAYGVITVPEGYTLASLTLAGIPTDLFVGGSLDLTDAVITATYTKEGAEDFVRELTVYDYDDTNFSGYDVNTVGAQTVVFTYEGVAAELPIHVWGHDFASGDVAVHVDGEEYGVTNVNVTTPSANTNVAAAIQYVIEGDNYVAYDITLTYSEGYTATEDVKTVTLPIPAGVTNPVVYYVPTSGSASQMNATDNGDGTVSFTTTHFSTYVVGNSVTLTGTETGATVPSYGDTTTTYSAVEKVVYKLVTTPESGKTYLIVNSNTGNGYGLDGDTTGYVTTAFTGGTGYYSSWDSSTNTGTAFAAGSDVYLTTSGAYLWTAGSNSFAIGYDSDSSASFGSTSYTYTLNPANGTSGTWGLSGNNLSISLVTTDSWFGSDTNTTYYLSGGSTWSMSTTAANIYFYEPVTIYEVTTSTEDNTTAEATYGMYITYPDSTGAYVDTQQAITAQEVAQGETLQLGAVFTSTVDGQTPPSTGTWYITSSNTGIATVGQSTGLVTFTGLAGSTLIQATYTWEENGETYSVSNYVTIATTAVSDEKYTIDLTDGEPDFNSITEPITIKNIQKGMTTSVWAIVKAGDVELGTLGDALSWKVSDTSIATIDTDTGVITFTGEEGTVDVTVYYTCPGGRVIQDTVTYSVTVGSYTVPEDGTNDFPEYPDPGAIRFDKHATAVGNFSETGIVQVELSMTGVPYGTDTAIDVVVMLDMTGSMSDNGMEAAEEATKAFVAKIVKNEDGTYNNNRVAVYAFNSGSSSPYELVSLKSISSDSALETANTAIDTASDKQASGGTPFDEATKQCYDVLQAAKTNLPEGETTYNRQQFCVFMSDGGPTTYYGSDEKTYYGGNNNSGDVLLASCMSGYSSSDSADWSFTLPTEYYTDALKADGVTVYTVGLLLQTAPNNPAPYSSMTDSTYDSTTDSLTTIGSHYYFTSSILKQMASDETKYIDIFNVDNASKATAAFESIAQSILDAATDVKVTDKISDDYTMVFEAPNSTVAGALPTGQEMYIEVKEYLLDPVYGTDGTTIVDYTRGTVASLMKLYLGKSGSTYYAASDASGTAYATPTFNQVAIGTMFYWTTTANTASGVSVTVDGTTYYFVEAGASNTDEDFDSTVWYNMASGAYAYGNITTTDIVDDSTGEVNGTNSTCDDLIIATPYFVYNAKTRMLVWTAEKLSTSELALSYFLYLDESGGYSGAADETDPGTYETNDYAYLNYTNFQGTECQQTMPVPQMTWNGAQVSYVFYLVNEAGQPVNRAGKVVPFSEAVYVTDVYTHSIVWNDLEQVASLEAEYLAEDLVPDVYTLFDAGATYRIHVFEDENEQNLNNHFVIDSGVSTYTTYVFNSKADATKYKTPGAYAAATTYKCKEYVDGGQYTDEKGSYNIVTKTDATAVNTGFDFSNTTVAFAVVWKPELVEDTVVVDFGLDVVIDVVTNDALASGVVGVRADAPSGVTMNSGTYDAAKATSVDVYIDANSDEAGLKELKIGTATVENLNSVRFSLDETNGMQFNKPVTFYYESDVNYYIGSDLQTTSMYSSVTVIPATTVYYEDSFVTFTNSSSADATYGTWSVDGTAANKTQDVDRPGANKLTAAYDADNVYGYDSAYASVATYSMGAAHKVHVDADSYATATFSFYGTGFDVIGMTSNDTGVLAVKVVKEGETKATTTKIVDTYYGYAYGNVTKVYTYTWLDATTDADGNTVLEGTYSWVLTSSAATTSTDKASDMPTNPVAGDTYTVIEADWYPVDAETDTDNNLYQVPVIKVEGLDYAKYNVTITATYMKAFDHTTEDGYDLYLDAIRIYDPTGVVSGSVTNATVSNAYEADNEDGPVYMELRDNLLKADDFEAGLETLEGAMFIDGIDSLGDAKIADYTSYGPNNEVYLAPGQGVAFVLSSASYVHVGMRRMTGTATYTIESYDENGNLLKSMTGEVASATDMYYDITDLKDGTIVIRNSGESGDLMITNLKYTPVVEEVSVAMFMTLRRSTAVLGALNSVDTDSDKTDDTVTGETETDDTETDDTVVEDTNNTETGDTVVEDTNNTENNDTVVEDTNTENDDTVVEETDTNAPAEDVPEEEIPEEDTPAEEEVTEETTEQLGFWARLWNAIKNAFNRLFSWFGF